jgi:hypothetical protein
MTNFVWFYLALTALAVASSSVTYVAIEKPFIALC